MNEVTQNQEQEIGALRSEITLTLHSQYATKLWQGRPVVKEGKKIIKPQILSIPNCLAILTQIQKDAANNDPFADLYLINFEEMVLKNATEMKDLIDQLMNMYADNIPDGINIQTCTNITPVTYPIYVNSPLGYKLIYLLCDFDMLAKTAMTASYIAIMTKSEAREWLEAGASLLRRCFGVIANYRHTGITREEAINNTARYQEIAKRFNLELPKDVLLGERRSEFAPDIYTNNKEDN